MRSMLFAFAIASPFILGACQTVASGEGHDLAQSVEGRVWHAEAIAGRDVVDGSTVTLKIEGGRVSGKAGCNGYGGPVEIHGDRVKFGAIFSTKMACLSNGVMEQEQRYLNVLQSATRGEIRGDGVLIISGDGGALEFRPD